MVNGIKVEDRLEGDTKLYGLEIMNEGNPKG